MPEKNAPGSGQDARDAAIKIRSSGMRSHAGRRLSQDRCPSDVLERNSPQLHQRRDLPERSGVRDRFALTIRARSGDFAFLHQSLAPNAAAFSCRHELCFFITRKFSLEVTGRLYFRHFLIDVIDVFTSQHFFVLFLRSRENSKNETGRRNRHKTLQFVFFRVITLCGQHSEITFSGGAVHRSAFDSFGGLGGCFWSCGCSEKDEP